MLQSSIKYRNIENAANSIKCLSNSRATKIVIGFLEIFESDFYRFVLLFQTDTTSLYFCERKTYKSQRQQIIAVYREQNSVIVRTYIAFLSKLSRQCCL